jgi:ribonuclease D
MIKQHLKVMPKPVYCTKLASKLIRTYTNRHSLKELCALFANVELSKQEQSSDWGTDALTKAQGDYAASDVLYLHKIKNELDVLLKRENRTKIAKDCFEFLPTVAELDLLQWEVGDIFSHS